MSIQHSQAAAIAAAAIKDEPTAQSEITALDENESEIQVVVAGGEVNARVYYPSETSPTGHSFSPVVSIYDPEAAERFRRFLHPNYDIFDPDLGLEVRPGLRIRGVI